MASSYSSHQPVEPTATRRPPPEILLVFDTDPEIYHRAREAERGRRVSRSSPPPISIRLTDKVKAAIGFRRRGRRRDSPRRSTQREASDQEEDLEVIEEESRRVRESKKAGKRKAVEFDEEDEEDDADGQRDEPDESTQRPVKRARISRAPNAQLQAAPGPSRPGKRKAVHTNRNDDDDEDQENEQDVEDELDVVDRPAKRPRLVKERDKRRTRPPPSTRRRQERE